MKLLNSCLEANVKQIIFSSTAAVYKQKGNKKVNEEDITDPINPYGHSKLMAEKILENYYDAYGLEYLIFRYFNVAGADPKMRTGQIKEPASHLIKVACEAATGKREYINLYGRDYNTFDKTAIRDFIHVSDLADAHILGLEYLQKGQISNRIFNCGYGKGYSVLQVINEVKKQSRKNIKIKYLKRRLGDAECLVSDNKLLVKNFNWKPKYNSLETIISDALAWEKKSQSKSYF